MNLEAESGILTEWSGAQSVGVSMYRAERLPTMDLYAMLKVVRAGESTRYVADNLQRGPAYGE